MEDETMLIFEAKIYFAPVRGSDFECSLGFFLTRTEAKQVAISFMASDVMPLIGTHLRGNGETFWVVVTRKVGKSREPAARVIMGNKLFG